MSRRAFLLAVTGAVAASLEMASGRDQAVPWSSGTEQPETKVPAAAADCHHHIYDARFPFSAKAVLRPGDATVREYRLLQKRLGTSRNVVVQPSTYGVDNRCLLDALDQFGTSARGIAVIDETVSEAELKNMDDRGVRGIRFNVVQAGGISLDLVEPLSKRIAPLGWHIQVNALPNQILSKAAVWRRAPVPVVFDHLAHVGVPGGRNSADALIGDLLAQNKAWVKLSGAYIDSKAGAPFYEDRSAIAKAYVKEAPERMVWGTDWPHPTTQDKPDDAKLMDLLRAWVPNEAVWRRILVENPKQLYGFA